MRKLLIGGIAATLIATSVAGVAIAQEKGEYRQARFAKELNLTEEQQTRMKQLWDQRFEERKEMRESRQGHGYMGAMRSLDPASETFQADVDKMIAEAQTRVAERIQDHARMKQEMSEILTPEQQAKMQEMMAQRGERGFGKHKGEGFGEGRNCR